jgi:hypothetical protein
MFFTPSPLFIPTFALNLAFPLKPSKLTMALSLSITHSSLFWINTTLSHACPARTLPLKTGRLSTCFALLITPYRPFSFTRSCHPPTGSRPLSTTIFLINRLPSTKTPNTTPFKLLHHKPPTYSDLRVFGCLCYPNTSATATHKLSPRSVPCVFLGYPSSHKGYRCLNLITQKLIISHHVILDETVFPFRFRYLDGHGTSMDFLLPPTSSPLMA